MTERVCMRKFTVFLLSLLLLCFCGVLQGCKMQERKGEAEIVLAAARDLVPGNKDPYYATTILKVWEPLVGISNDGEAVPVLAESWENNENKTEWIFHLKRNVIFQDGESFDAPAAVENFKRYQNMGYRPSTFYGFLIDRIYPGLEAAEAVGNDSLRLRFKHPVPMLIYRMAGWGSAMFSPKCFNSETGDWTGIAKGTGPFQIVERVPDSYAVLERFDGYHGEKAKAKRIRIRTIPSPDTRYSAMKSGEIQGVLDLGGLAPIMAEELERDGRFSVNSAHSTISHYLTLNGSRFPFQDERMRRAIDLAVDREKIVNHYFRGFAVPTRSFLNSTNPFGHIEKPVYDPVKAKELAREVLGDKRVTVKFLLPQYGMARYPYKVISEFIQAELKPLGLDAKIVMVDSMTSKKLMRSGDYDLSIGTRGLGNLDPTSLLSEYFASDGATNKANHIGYENAVVDDCFERLKTTYDIDERRAIYTEILDQLLLHPPGMIPLMEDENIAVSSNALGGYDAAVYGITLDKVYWKKEDT